MNYANIRYSCSWVDPENNDPPVVFYEGDQGIGKYSVSVQAPHCPVR